MEPLIIERTEMSPEIKFDLENNVFEISGESRPENVRKFYNPVIEWIRKLNEELQQEKQSNNNTTNRTLGFTFKFDYLNSSSIKYVYDVLLEIEQLKNNVQDIKVNWLYDKGDDLMMENGEDFAEMVPTIHFNIVPI